MWVVSDFLLVYHLMMLPITGTWLVVRRPTWRRGLVVCTGLTYAGLLLAVTFFPMPVDAEVIRDMRLVLADGGRQHNLTPLASIIEVLQYQPPSVAMRVVAGNVIALVPLGFLLPFLARRCLRVRATVGAVALVSLLIESLQFSISTTFGFVHRSLDVDDLVLNTLGGFCGWLLYSLAMRVRWSRAEFERLHLWSAGARGAPVSGRHS